jgi:hypothetical protein
MPGPEGVRLYCDKPSVFEARVLCYNGIVTPFRFCAYHRSRSAYAADR